MVIHTTINYTVSNFGSAIQIDLEFESIFNLNENNLNEKKISTKDSFHQHFSRSDLTFLRNWMQVQVTNLRLFFSHCPDLVFSSPFAEFLDFFAHHDFTRFLREIFSSYFSIVVLILTFLSWHENTEIRI